MGLIDATLTGIFAARIASRLLDLGVDVKRLDRAAAARLFEIENTRRKVMSPAEAAGMFFGVAFPYIEESAYTLPITRLDMVLRAGVIMGQWVKKGEMREAHFETAMKQLRTP